MTDIKTSNSSSTDWFVLRGESKYGPYDYSSMIEMIQNGELSDYNFVWAPHLEKWTVIVEVADFSKDRLRLLIETNDPLVKFFEKRKFPRRKSTIPVYAHNNHVFCDGETVTISEKGGLFLLNNPLLSPGERVLLHFKKTDENPISFNALGEIKRKNYSKNRLNIKSGLLYIVRFNEVQSEGSNQLLNWKNNNTTLEEN
jgi:hypothetical protein